MKPFAACLGLILAAALPAWGNQDDVPLVIPDDGPLVTPPESVVPPDVVDTTGAAPIQPNPPQNDVVRLPEGQFPRGIVDAEWKIAYVVGTGGSVEATDLRTGKKLWASASAGVPIAISGDRVYLLTVKKIDDDTKVTVRVTGMSIKGQGKYVFESKPLDLPDWVAEGKAHTLYARGIVEKGSLTVGYGIQGGEEALPDTDNGRQQLVQQFGGKNMVEQEVLPSLTTGGWVQVALEKGTVETIKADALVRELDAKVPGATLDEALAEPRSKIIATHDGRDYVLAPKANGEMELTCQDPQKQTTLWQRTVSASPGRLPGLCLLPPVEVLAPEIRRLFQNGGRDIW